MSTPKGQRRWGTAVLGEGSILVEVGEVDTGRLALVHRESGETRVVGSSASASLRPGDDLRDGVWDLFWQQGSGGPMRVHAAVVDPRARVVHRDRGRTRVIAAYRTGGGGLSLRVVERVDCFEVAALAMEDGALVITGALQSRDPRAATPGEALLAGSGRGAGMSALVPAVVAASASAGPDLDSVTVTVPLDRIRLAEYAARSSFRVALQGADGRAIDVAAITADLQGRRRLSRPVEAWVADPEEVLGNVEEHPSASRIIRAGVADDGDVWVDVVSPGPAR